MYHPLPEVTMGRRRTGGRWGIFPMASPVEMQPPGCRLVGGQGWAGGKAQPVGSQVVFREHLNGFVVYLPLAQPGSEGMPMSFCGLCMLTVSRAPFSRSPDLRQSYLLSFETELGESEDGLARLPGSTQERC